MFRNLRVNSIFFRPRFLPRFQSNAHENPKTSMLLEVRDHPGSLTEALKYFWKYDINLTHIESRPSKKDNDSFEFLVDFVGEKSDEKVQKLMDDLSKFTVRMFVLDGREVPWFPRHSSELDSIAHRVLDAGIDLQADHPGFKDPNYRIRRSELASVALNYRAGNTIPNISYSQPEVETWGAVFDRMLDLQRRFACKEYLEIFPLMERECGYARNNIPQQEDISQFLQKRTGFHLRPVAGLLSSRDFLNGLAFRIFFSTQYIRHHSVPLYTPEPDICHELIGHAPMFADSDFADFSQEIGLASLGASDEEIEKLARCYWYSVEFGVTRENGHIKAYGAGLLSSFGELEYACAPYRPAGGENNYPVFQPWEPDVAARLPFPITTYQPVYFLADSLHDAKEKMRLYCEQMKKPFHARYNPLSQTIWVDRAVRVNTSEKK